MLSLIKGLVETIGLVINLLIHLVQTIVIFIGSIPSIITYLVSLLTVIPSFALSYAVIGISLTVMILIISKQQAG